MLTFDVLQVSDIFCKNWKINILFWIINDVLLQNRVTLYLKIVTLYLEMQFIPKI